MNPADAKRFEIRTATPGEREEAERIAATPSATTSPIMKAAVPLYLSMGFASLRELPDEMGVPCVIYTLPVGRAPAQA